MSWRAVILLLLCGAMVAACGKRGERAARGGVSLPYRSTLQRSADAHEFTIAVEHKGAGIAEIRESVRYPATRYCIYNYGGSDIEWNSDPVTGDWSYGQAGDRLVFSGRCLGRI